MKYRSTRSNETVTAIEALVKGLADDGGLYVPEVLPLCCPISSPIFRKKS